MPPTLSNIAMPPQIQQEIPPTIDGLISQIDPWVLYHLKSVISSSVHYENHLYGPINSFIGSIFLTRRRYMTIPQALLRRALDADEVDEYLADISFGSTGGLHESRDLGGNEVDKKIPDFLIVKVLPTPPHLPRAYTIVCLIEVKRDDLTTPQMHEQMTQYMYRALEHGSFSDDFRGYLVMGEEVRVYGYRVTDPGTFIVEVIDRFSMLDGGDLFTRGLSQISINNWNRD